MSLLPGDPQPPTSFSFARACGRRYVILPAPTALRYVPNVPQSIPRCCVTPLYHQIPIGSVTAKQRGAAADLTLQWWRKGETHVRIVRSSHGIGSVLGGVLQSRTVVVWRPLSHRSRLSRFDGPYSARWGYCVMLTSGKLASRLARSATRCLRSFGCADSPNHVHVSLIYDLFPAPFEYLNDACQNLVNR